MSDYGKNIRRKKEKEQVSKKSKERLLDIGYEQFERAINRYREDLKENKWRKPQYGSTFFNTGYEDYLDKKLSATREDGKTAGKQKLKQL